MTRMRPACVSLAMMMTVLGAAAQAPQVPEVAPTQKDLEPYEGQDVRVCGRVVMYTCDDERGTLELQLNSPASDNVVSIAVPRDLWPEGSGRQVTDSYLFAPACARGTVQRVSKEYHVVVRAYDHLQKADGSPAKPAPWAPEATHVCAAGVTKPALRREVKPRYSGEARQARQVGKIYLEAVVLANGRVGDVRPISTLAPEHGLTRQAVIALKRWQFQPATTEGRPVPVVVVIEMTFALR